MKNNATHVLRESSEGISSYTEFAILSGGVFFFFGIHNLLQEAIMNIPGFNFGVMLGTLRCVAFHLTYSCLVGHCRNFSSLLLVVSTAILFLRCDSFTTIWIRLPGSTWVCNQAIICRWFSVFADSASLILIFSKRFSPFQPTSCHIDLLMQCGDMYFPGTQICGKGDRKGRTNFSVSAAHGMFNGFVISFESFAQLHQLSYQGMLVKVVG